ncbi:MAG TPA: creatininase family protein [Clostridiaceae bacterium]|nr:creatininase family protein [Clostridiaceae bacterium]
MNTVQMAEITSRECKKYLEEGGDLVFVPMGSIERLGPHLPLASKCFVVYAISEALAKRNRGYCLPVLPYSTLYDTYSGAGSMSVDAKILYDYTYDISKELMENGFRRIIFVSYFKELYYVIAEFFQEKDLPIAWISPDQIPFPEAKDENTRVTSLVAACLKLCGREDLLERLLAENKKHFGKFKGPLSERYPLSELRKLGRMGYHFKKDEYEILPVETVLVDEAVAAINKWVEEKVPAVEALKEYAYYISRARFDRGLR